MASTVLTGDRRWGSTRKSGMTVLGKVPKPINLPSQRLENHGLDPNVEIVPKGTLTWGSRPSPVPNAWGSSALLSPNTDGSSGSPSHVSGRPSSGSGTRPSTAGSDRSQELGSNARCSNSRPSSASGPLTSSHISAVVTRPRSAETRPSSSQLSRFAEPPAESTVAWGPARSSGSSERMGAALSISNEFTLSSGDFPSLGTDKSSSDTQTQRGHSSHGRPGSSGAAATQKEASTPLSAGDNNADTYSDRGNVMSWKADGYPYVCSAPPNVNWQTEPPKVQAAQPYPSGNLPSHQFVPWQNAPVHSPGGVWYRGGAMEGPFRPAGIPGSYSVEPYGHYPQFPVNQPNSEPQPRPATSEGGYHSKNMVSYHHQRPPDSHMVPNHQVIPIRPGFYPAAVSYEGYYGPPRGTFCISSEHEVHIMRSAAGGEPISHSITESEGHSTNPVSTINSSKEISLLRKPDTATHPNLELQKHPAIKHDVTLIAKIESLNNKARNADDSIESKEKKNHARVASRADHSRNEISINPLPSESAPRCDVVASNSDDVDASEGNMNKKSPIDELCFAEPSEPLASGGGKSDSFEAVEKVQSKANKKTHFVRGRVGEEDDAQFLTNVSDTGSGLSGEKGQSKAHKRLNIVRGKVGEGDHTQLLTHVSDAASGLAGEKGQSKAHKRTHILRGRVGGDDAQLPTNVSDTGSGLADEKAQSKVLKKPHIVRGRVGGDDAQLPTNVSDTGSGLADEKVQSKALKKNHIMRGRVGEDDDAHHRTNVTDTGSSPAESSSETITNQIPVVPPNQGSPQATEKMIGRADNHWKSQSSRKSISNQGPPQATEKVLGRTDNHWKSQSSRKSIRNQQASRPVDKLHGSEAVVWAPVKPSSPETNQTTTKISDQTSGKNEHDMQSAVKTKRAEMERYVPKPAAKELSQQDNSQEYSRSLDHEEHGSSSRKPEPKLEISEKDQLSKLSSLPEKEFQHDEGNTSNAKLVPTEKISQPVVIKDQRLPGRRRHEYVVHNIELSGGGSNDKDFQKRTVDKNDTQSPKLDSDESDRRIAPRTKNHNPVGERMKSQWQPKNQAQSPNILHGNVGDEGQGAATEEVRPIGELQSQGAVGYFPKNRNSAPVTRATGTGRHTLRQEASQGQPEEETCTANQDLLTDAELAYGSAITKDEHLPVPRRQRHQNNRFNRTQEAGYKVVEQNTAKQSPQLDGNRRKGIPHHEVSKGQSEEQTYTANQDPLTNAELAYGTTSTKHEHQAVNSAPRRQRHQNNCFNRGQEAAYKVVGQDVGEQSPHLDGDRRKGTTPHHEYQRIEPYNRVGDSLRQKYVSSEEVREGPRVQGSSYRVRGGHNHPRRGGQFYAQRSAAVQDGDFQ